MVETDEHTTSDRGTVEGSILTVSTEIHPDKYREFMDHACDYRKNIEGEMPNLYTFTFVVNTVGTTVRMGCDCGLEADVTNYENW